MDPTRKKEGSAGTFSSSLRYGVCAWCDDDIILPDAIKYRGKRFHQKCAMKYAVMVGDVQEA